MLIIYLIGSLTALTAGYIIGRWHTLDKQRAQHIADKPAEIHCAAAELHHPFGLGRMRKDNVVRFTPGRGRGF